MADYRDPKVTTTQGRSGRGMGTWIGLAIAALIILALIWWWWGGTEDTAVVEPVEPVAPATEGTVTEEPVTEQPAAPAQQ